MRLVIHNVFIIRRDTVEAGVPGRKVRGTTEDVLGIARGDVSAAYERNIVTDL